MTVVTIVAGEDDIGHITDPSTVQKKLLIAGRIARKPSKQQLLTPVVMKNDFGGLKYLKLVYTTVEKSCTLR